MPSDSTIEAIVDAVPIVMQWPRERFMHDSASMNSCWLIVPARTSSDICHTPVPEPEWLNRTINIDTGCVFGGRLTALRYPELELVSVTAHERYAEPVRPFLVDADPGSTA